MVGFLPGVGEEGTSYILNVAPPHLVAVVPRPTTQPSSVGIAREGRQLQSRAVPGSQEYLMGACGPCMYPSLPPSFL